MRLSLVSQHLLVLISVLSLTRAQSTTAQTIFPLITTHSTNETTTTSATTASSLTTAPTTTFAPIASPLTTSASTTLAALPYDPCYNYTVLDDLRRATDNQLQSSYYAQYTSKLLCDTDVNWVGWYRLFIRGQSVQMPDTCVDQLSCGTHAPLWLNGQHPRIEDGVVTRSVCGHWWDNCCGFQSNPIKVKACPGGYYVYEFVRPVNCFLAYCADVRNISINNHTVTPEPSFAAPAIFYPFGSAAGDTNNAAVDDGNSSVIQLLSPFPFFGRTYQQIYVNNNGYLTFNEASSEYVPYSFPASRSQDVIAGLWTDLDNRQRGVVSYHQYTSGNVLTRATQDINTQFPNLNFTASWVFVATWDKVAYYSSTNTETSFQVILIADSHFSFILMNYGEIAVTGHPVQAGYDTINSTHYIVINGSNSGSSISNLRNSSNVGVSGRWAFRVDGGLQIYEVNPTSSTTTVSTAILPVTAKPAPAIFYPFGSTVGDKSNPVDDDGSSSVIQLLSPFLFFGRTYQQIYVNNNGHLTFDKPSSLYTPYSFPANRSQDIIAGLWTDLNNNVRGVISYQQYTDGNVLTRASQDINTHFPNLTSNASWVFVATWDKVAYFNFSSTETSFQVVLISDGNFSFILMNYGDIAVTEHPVQAGYDTVNSTDYFVIPGSNDGSIISNLRNSSNVNVTGRWVFRVDSGQHNISKETATTNSTVIGFRVRIKSFLDLTNSTNTNTVLQQIKREMVKYGLPNSIELKLRKVQRINP